LDGREKSDGAVTLGTGDPVALAQALVRTPSVNPELEEGGTGEGAVAELAAGWLDQWGFDTATTSVAEGRFNVIGRLGARDRRRSL